MLMCIGRNIRKVFTLLDSKKIKSNYWEKPNNLKTEKLPFPKQKNQKKKAVMKLFHFMTAPILLLTIEIPCKYLYQIDAGHYQ